MDENIPELNLFMMCAMLNRDALTEMPAPYRVRGLRRDEWPVWKALQWDDAADVTGWDASLEDYRARVYAPRGDGAFFAACRVAVDGDDVPVASCFVWPAYGRFATIHWLKVRRAYEGLGIGRALMSAVMAPLAEGEYPVYLHTHPSCYRAVGLYADLGFALLEDAAVGARRNDVAECLPILRRVMPPTIFARLRTARAGQDFLDAAAAAEGSEF